MVLRCQFNTCLVKAVFLTMSSMLSWCTKMYKQKFWMCYFGSPSMKRTILWSTGSPIAALKKFQTMQRKDFEFDGAAKTAEKYLNSRGEVAYKGTKALKGTQCPGCTSFSTSFSTLFQNTCSEEKTLFILEGLPLSLDEKWPTEGICSSLCWLCSTYDSILQWPQDEASIAQGQSWLIWFWGGFSIKYPNFHPTNPSANCGLKVDTSKPLLEVFASMELGDTWDDACMRDVVCYLRGSRSLVIPSEWRPLISNQL